MSVLDRFLEIGLRTRTPGLIVGPPGVGKSASVQSWAAKRGLETWVVIASLREPTDFAGLPVVSKHSVTGKDGREFPLVHFAPPRFAAEAEERGGVIFLDEITTAPPAVQAALLRAVLDLAFGDLELSPEKVAIIAAANPPELAAGGWDLAPPLANRFRHRSYTLDPQAWTEEFPSYWGKPPALGFGNMKLDEFAWAKARSMVAGFLRSRPSNLLMVPQEETRRGAAWPSPRTWDYASRQLGAIMAEGMPATEALPYIADAVGSGGATEFMAWCRDVDLPDPWELLRHPNKFSMPKRSDVAFAVLTSVAAAAISDLNVENWKAAWNIIGQASKAGAKDVAAAACRTLAAKNSSRLPKPPEAKDFIPLLKSSGLWFD